MLSGDEDIREGVAEAQDQGISVVLLGISPLPGQYNQARSLVQEADDPREAVERAGQPVDYVETHCDKPIVQ